MKNSSLAALSLSALTLVSGCSSSDDAPLAEGEHTFTLESPLASANGYRLVGLWTQLSDDGEEPAPQVAFDVAFDPAASTVTFPAAATPTDPVLYCQRSRFDESSSPCLGASPYRIGIGWVLISEDVDGDGKFTFDPANPDVIEAPVLFADGALVYSAKGGDVLPDRQDGVLVESPIAPGTTYYQSFKDTPSSTFERLRRPTSDKVTFGAVPKLK